MDGQAQENTDSTSLKPVSSLRSHFENMIKSKPPPPIPSPSLGPSRGTLAVHPTEAYSRGASLDIPRPSQAYAVGSTAVQPQVEGDKSNGNSSSGTPKLRPVSMGPLSPPRSPPLVTVDSPRSPPKEHSAVARSPFMSAQPSIESLRRSTNSRSDSPQPRPFKTQSRAATPGVDIRRPPILDATPSQASPGDPLKVPSPDHESGQRSSPPAHIPPPVNRAGKPKVFAKPPIIIPETRKVSDSLLPRSAVDRGDQRVSPFSTPPSEPESPSKNPTPPQIPEFSKPQLNPIRPPRDGYFSTSQIKQNLQDSPLDIPSAISEPNWTEKLKYANRREEPALGSRSIDTIQPPFRPSQSSSRQSPELGEQKPTLPARHDNTLSQPGSRRNSPPRRRLPPPPPSEPPFRRSMDVQSARPTATSSRDTSSRASIDVTSSHRATAIDNSAKFQPPPRRNQIPAQSIQSSNFAPSKPALPRQSSDQRRPEASAGLGKAIQSVDDSEEEEGLDLPTGQGSLLSDYPDSSQTNRRPPRFRRRPFEIHTKYDTKLFAVCGEYLCTSGYITKVWNLLTGELIMNVPHGETTKVTAIAFKPASLVEDEGKRLWLGTNLGELHEIDVMSGTSVASKTNAHAKMTITRIHRHAADMWTLDEQGTLCIWPAGDDSLPSLSLSPHICRIPSGATYSIIAGEQLWVAFGKELMVYQPNPSQRNGNPLVSKPLQQSNVGDVTAGAVIGKQTNLIYFGHIDGKVTIYDTKDFSCTGVVNVSLYKISCLVGVGDYLWAGFNTGMVYVYDTSSQPWKVMKDWRAHQNTIAGITVDRTSIWKLDRLQVASLGTDGLVKIWDGMLEQDWLEVDMQKHDTEFCEFRELTALVMTWNAGASKPAHLRHDEQDSNFFRDLLHGPKEPPDFVVFGFQELVDLEDKKVTAKNIFKSSKKKDSSEKEHMAKQYRAWRDHLQQSLDTHMPSQTRYTLLHSADLVGLFTCVFVKSALRTSITEVDAAEIKLGMKGRYGNKGALVVRFFLDDSSICFVNCHLAAGQKHTAHRNNDIAAIMESSALQARHDASDQLDTFVSGGDGSMILDHEICILNGDLNYRIDAMSRDIVIREVQAGNLQRLLEKDQLLLSRKRNPGFRLRAFQEKEITFPPTYKYDVGTDRYDTSEKKRSPAWCDRLLYRGVGRIKQIEYRRHEVRVSDHRPVSGLFRLRVKTIDRKRQAAARQGSEERFEEVRRRIAMDIKLDYLVSVLGMARKDAERSLKR